MQTKILAEGTHSSEEQQEYSKRVAMSIQESLAKERARFIELLVNMVEKSVKGVR